MIGHSIMIKGGTYEAWCEKVDGEGTFHQDLILIDYDLSCSGPTQAVRVACTWKVCLELTSEPGSGNGTSLTVVHVRVSSTVKEITSMTPSKPFKRRQSVGQPHDQDTVACAETIANMQASLTIAIPVSKQLPIPL